MRGVSLGSLAVWAALMAYMAAFLIYPIAYVFYKAFIIDGTPTLAYFQIMFQDPVLRECIVNSFKIATITTVLTVALGYAIAFVMVRCEFPLRGFFGVALLIPFIVPPFVGALGMLRLFARLGAVNILLMDLGLIDRPIDWFGNRMAGIIFMEVLHLYPIAYLNIAAALANIDPTLEESAETLGVRGLRKLVTVTIPLSMPGVAAASAIVFIWSFTDLGTPLMFNFYKVIPVQIFTMSQQIYTNPMGYALTVFVLMLISVVFVGIKKYTGMRSYEMMGRGHVTGRVARLGRATSAAVIIFLGAVVLLAALPHISIILLSVSDEWFMSVLPTRYTLEHFLNVFENDLTSKSVRNSLVYSLAATALATAIGISSAYVANRGALPSFMRDLLDTLTMWPLAVPGVAIAFGYLSSFADVPLLSPYVNPAPLLIISYATRRLPYMVRAIYAGLQQVHRSLEEAALSLGSRPLRVVRQITLPLILANVFAGGVLVFSECMIEVSDSLILALRQEYYPMTKAIFELSAHLVAGTELASAMGVVLMVVVAVSMVVTNRVMGQRMGELFKA